MLVAKLIPGRIG